MLQGRNHVTERSRGVAAGEGADLPGSEGDAETLEGELAGFHAFRYCEPSPSSK